MPDTRASSATPPEVVDLDALAAGIAGSLEDPTYALTHPDVPPGEGFLRFQTASTHSAGVGEVTIRATVELASDGEDEIEGVAGAVVEITVRRVAP
jgi:hypothetical protein